jgi:Flp pilus assembly protein protease CpaA
MGSGDIRLLAWSGFLLGRQIAAAFVLSMWAGAVVCIVLRKRKLAYVPLFLAGILPTVTGLIDPLVLLYLPK